MALSRIGILRSLKCVVALSFALGIGSFAAAQTTDATAAKDAYFAAQSLYESGQYDDALAKLDEAKRLRGATDAYFLALRARIELAREDYDKATDALMAFADVTPTAELSAAMRDVRVVVDREQAKEIALWTEECTKNKGWACTNVGITYRFAGYGRYATDDAIAAIFYERGCNGNNGLGCTNLGFLVEKGQSVQKDEVRARALYKRGCDLNHALGCANLGYLMEKGIGGSVDIMTAADYNRQGCEGNVGRACYNLALQYRKTDGGIGVDFPRARSLMEKGCRLGHRSACDKIDG